MYTIIFHSGYCSKEIHLDINNILSFHDCSYVWHVISFDFRYNGPSLLLMWVLYCKYFVFPFCFLTLFHFHSLSISLSFYLSIIIISHTSCRDCSLFFGYTKDCNIFSLSIYMLVLLKSIWQCVHRIQYVKNFPFSFHKRDIT